MKICCNAKINLGLNIVSKRPDGYHNIETVFYPLPIYDVLDIELAEKDSYSQSGIALDCPDEKNLVLKAKNLLAKDYELPPLAISLEKNIPFGAGLGGGSSDAAFTLRLINQVCGLKLSPDELEAKAATLGADCAFFVRNTAVFAHGIGNIFEPCDVSLKGLHFVLVKPNVSVPTAAAYKLTKPKAPDFSLRKLANLPISQWEGKVVNDFEESVFEQYPVIGEIKAALYKAGAAFACMSGSGSSVFGIFSEKPEPEIQVPSAAEARLFYGTFK